MTTLGLRNDGRAIVVMARSPFVDIDAIKSRLAPVVPREADRQALYVAFLRDTIAKCRTVPGVDFRLAFKPGSSGEGFDALGVAEHERLPQRGANLGERERAVFQDVFADGFSRVVLTGSDLPTLPATHLEDAFAELDRGAELVLGPADDGGYYLIGLNRPEPASVPDVFTEIRWSTRHTLEDTLCAAAGVPLTPAFVPRWHDVDDSIGWERLQHDLEDPHLSREAPLTTQEVRRIVTRP